MKRTTVSLPDPVADALTREARRRSVSASQVVREALSDRLGLGDDADVRPLPFAALGRSGRNDVSARADELLAAEWSDLAGDR